MLVVRRRRRTRATLTHTHQRLLAVPLFLPRVPARRRRATLTRLLICWRQLRRARILCMCEERVIRGHRGRRVSQPRARDGRRCIPSVLHTSLGWSILVCGRRQAAPAEGVWLDRARNLVFLLELHSALEERVVLSSADEVERYETQSNDACNTANCAPDDGANVARTCRGDAARRKGDLCVTVSGDIEDAVRANGSVPCCRVTGSPRNGAITATYT